MKLMVEGDKVKVMEKEKDTRPKLTITISGATATGKTTIANLIANALSEYGITSAIVEEFTELVQSNERTKKGATELGSKGLSVVIETKQVCRRLRPAPGTRKEGICAVAGYLAELANHVSDDDGKDLPGFLRTLSQRLTEDELVTHDPR